jgi:hypothetical protein
VDVLWHSKVHCKGIKNRSGKTSHILYTIVE